MQLVGMNKETGQLGLVIPICIMRDLVKIEGVDGFVSFVYGEPDGYLVFTGKPDDDGPWVFVQKEAAQKFEVLGEL